MRSNSTYAIYETDGPSGMRATCGVSRSFPLHGGQVTTRALKWERNGPVLCTEDSGCRCIRLGGWPTDNSRLLSPANSRDPLNIKVARKIVLGKEWVIWVRILETKVTEGDKMIDAAPYIYLNGGKST